MVSPESAAAPESQPESESEIERLALLDVAEDHPVLRPLTEAYRAKLAGAEFPAAPLPQAEKLRLEQYNRDLLEEDLLLGRLEFRSRPRVVELQLSNFCNMSCTMCYDGENPKLKQLDEKLVLALAEDLLPTASVLIPFATSEPLIVTWALTKRLAESYGVELELTTNVQFLDEAKLPEVEPHIGLIAFSIDSHLQDIYEAIRLNSRPEKVFRNLPIAARYLGERGVEVVTNVVFMVENAPFLDRTVAWLADQGIRHVHVQKLFYNKGRTWYSDPTVHFSREWIDWMKAKVRAVARDKRIRVSLDFDGHEVVDALPPEISFRPNRTRDGWLEKLRRHFPGYCPQSVYRFKVDADGSAFPCCVGVGERLKLGNLYEQGFDEIWNGPSSRDLRRAMLTQDLPLICRECNFRTGPIMPEVPQLPFCDLHFVWLESHPERWTIELEEPAHLARIESAPTLRWSLPAEPVDRFEVVLSRGGEQVDHVVSLPGTTTSWTVPDTLWQSFAFHMAQWWMIWGINDTDRRLSFRGRALRAFIRHRDVARIPDSTLNYDRPEGH